MSDTSQTRGTQRAAGVPRQRDAMPEPTGWVGWVAFAAVMMIMIGAFHAIAGLVALFNSSYYLVTESNLVVNVSYTTWGWVHLIGGVVVAAAGFAVMVGQTWARVVGVVVAALSALINLAFLAAYPVWSTIIIALDVLVIYALIVHGREMRSA